MEAAHNIACRNCRNKLGGMHTKLMHQHRQESVLFYLTAGGGGQGKHTFSEYVSKSKDVKLIFFLKATTIRLTPGASSFKHQCRATTQSLLKAEIGNFK